ncbi:hypothetical protein MXB_1100 [Myxobolus squamalis]|nr:hypothetical protein MXB_1100 [Myxobolus squamalis]
MEPRFANKLLHNHSINIDNSVKLIKIICDVLSKDNDVSNAVDQLKINALKIIGLEEYSEDVIKPICRRSFILSQVFCMN